VPFQKKAGILSNGAVKLQPAFGQEIDMNKIQWTEDERLALQELAKKPNHKNNALKPAVSVRLYEQGYVVKGGSGNIELSESGKSLLNSLRDIKRAR
jgi:hypothetical protein